MNKIKERFYYQCNNLLDGVNEKKVENLNAQSKQIKIKKGKALFKEGEFSDGLYQLKKGKIKLYQLTPAGKFQILYLYTKGDFFGFRPLLSQSKHSVSAVAIEDCDLIFYPKGIFLKLVDGSSVLMKNLLYILSYEFNIWVNRMKSFSHKGVKERVALTLLILHEKYKKHDNEKNININFSREDLASMSGTTTETCVRILTQFKEKELIDSNGRKIKLTNYPELLKIADVV